jgi:hypothetical protein
MKKISAHVCYLLSAIVTFGLIFSANARADFDLHADGLLRSYPESGYVDLQVGYGFLIWGAAGPGNYFYGYIRPFAEIDTGGTYNSGLLGVELFPLSFLGVRVGKEWIQNDYHYRGADCAIYNCGGARQREYIEGHLLVGYGPWFLSMESRWDFWKQKDPHNSDFIEPTSYLATKADGDTQLVINGFTGYEVAPGWSAVAGVSYYQMTRHPGITRFELAGARWKKDTLSVTVAGTYFDSTEVRNDAGVLGWIAWDIVPGLALQ